MHFNVKYNYNDNKGEKGFKYMMVRKDFIIFNGDGASDE